ncbi:MAG TPA: hypothetical protein VFE58_01320 [Tepidisphaeraceae bacterium]|jgi:HTH-type transcriptional regulator/antitoxin HigA|nr:hypothetical protein [Tepidisphaeraceae bacterium]
MSYVKIADTFLTLVQVFPLRPIRTKAEHAKAAKMLTRLIGTKSANDRNADERDYIQTLTMLVADYQQKHRAIAMDDIDPIKIVRHLMEENNLTVTDLGEIIGNRPAASMFLNRRRKLSKSHILRLSNRFHLNPQLFL